MTRKDSSILTVVALALFVALTWAFADGQFTTVWNADDWPSSAIFTYLFLLLIGAAGWYQSSRLPETASPLRPPHDQTTPGQIDDPRLWKLLLGNTYFALIWLPVRLFVGREWLSSGTAKLRSDAWMDGGSALQGYWTNAVQIPAQGSPPVTYDWFRNLLQYMLDHEWYTWFAKVIAIGEFLVGLGLIVGALVGIAAFFGTVMNVSYMLAGSASTNPILFGLSVFLVLAWKIAGYWGLDRWLLPTLGVPWSPGTAFQHASVSTIDRE